MAKFLIAVWPYSGHVHPCIALALALRAGGHQVAFYTGALGREAVEQAGFPCFPFQRLADRVATLVGSRDHSDHPALYWGLNERYTTVAEKNPFKRLFGVNSLFREMLLGTIAEQIADHQELLARWQPDILITDPFMWGPLLVGPERYSVPIAIFSFYAGCLIAGPEVPMAGLGLPRARNAPTRFLNRAAAKVAYALTAHVRRVMNEVRRQHGLAPMPATLYQFSARLPLHLVTTSPEYDYQRRDLPASVHYVGPCLYDRPSPPAEREWLGRLPSDPPIVYVTEGTCQVRGPIVLRAAMEGLRSLPVQAIMSTGMHADRQNLPLRPVPPNITVKSWVSHGELFPKTRVVVTSGGSNTVRAALHAGVPLIVIPMEWDQLENAQRVAEAGAGIRIPLRKCTARRLRAAVERLLREPSFAQNARRIGESFARYGQGRTAAELLENLYESGHRAMVLK